MARTKLVRKNGKETSASNPRAAGRPKGSYRIIRQANLEAQLQAIRSQYEILPLEYAMAVLNNKREPNERRQWAASQAMGFVHSKLAAVDVRQIEPPPRYTLDLSKLTDEELIELRRITAKAQTPLIEARPPMDVDPVKVTPDDAE
jgi:hypothetical protein